MAENRPDSQPPRLDPLVAGPPRFGPGARTLIVAGMVGACAMGAVAGTWARPDLSDLKQAKVQEKAPNAAPAAARPVLQIVDADLMPPPSERLEVLPAWVEVPIPAAAEPGPLRKVVLEEPPPPPKPSERPELEPRPMPVKAEAGAPRPKAPARSETRKVEKRKSAAPSEAKLVKARAGTPKAAKPQAERAKLQQSKPETPKREKVKLEEARADKKLVKAKAAKAEKAKPEGERKKKPAERGEEPRLIKAKLDKSTPKPNEKARTEAAAKVEAPPPSKVRQAIAKLKPASKPKDTVVAASPAKPNKVEKVQRELAELSALPVEKRKPVAVAQARPKAKPAPEKPRCQAGSRAEALLCENPQLAAADRRLARAYREAAEAGAPEWRLRRQQGRWLAARERAAEEAPWAVAEVYDARIAELEDEAAIARERF